MPEIIVVWGLSIYTLPEPFVVFILYRLHVFIFFYFVIFFSFVAIDFFYSYLLQPYVFKG